ncbi:MAG: M12 family metallo-peptidase [Bacteroidota bacterium]
MMNTATYKEVRKIKVRDLLEVSKRNNSENAFSPLLLSIDIPKTNKTKRIANVWTNPIHTDLADNGDYIYCAELFRGERMVGEITLKRKKDLHYGKIAVGKRLFWIFSKEGMGEFLAEQVVKLEKGHHGDGLSEESGVNQLIFERENGPENPLGTNPVDIQNSTQANSVSGDSEIDVLVVYSPGFTGANPRQMAETEVLFTNLAFGSSEVRVNGRPLRLNLLDVVPTTFESVDDSRRSIELMQSNNNIRSLRNQYGADLVVAFTSGGLGAANGVSSIREFPNPETGFAAIVEGFSPTEHVFAHEVAHNLGCKHDNDNFSSSFIRRQSKGYTAMDSRGRVKTIMVVTGRLNRARVFSNPGVRIFRDISDPGIIIGSPDNDNAAQMMDIGGQRVINYRSRASMNPTVSITGPSTGFGLQSITLRSNLSNIANPVSYRWETNNGGLSFSRVGGNSSVLTTTLPPNPFIGFVQNIGYRVRVTTSAGQVFTSEVFNVRVIGGLIFAEASTEQLIVEAEPSGSEETTGKGITEGKGTMFPNPTSHYVTVAGDFSDHDKVKVYISGITDPGIQRVLNTEMAGGKESVGFSMESFPSGLYQADLVSKGKVIFSQKLIVEY